MSGLIDFSLGDVGSLFKGIREAITGEAIEDPNKKAELLYNMKLLEQEMLRGQMAINKTEAQHKSIFVAGWRPFIGWSGGFAIAYNYIAQPFIYTILMANDIDIPMPVLDIGTLMTLITGMLGFGALRSFDKTKGVSNGA
jgi:hypothetical protein